MTINELEAYELVCLIKALKAYKKGGSSVHFTNSLSDDGMIDQHGKVNKGSLRYLNAMEKKLKALIIQADKIHAQLLKQ